MKNKSKLNIATWVLALFPEKPRFVLMLVIVGLIVLVPSVASYLWYRQEEKPGELNGD